MMYSNVGVVDDQIFKMFVSGNKIDTIVSIGNFALMSLPCNLIILLSYVIGLDYFAFCCSLIVHYVFFELI